MKSLTIRVTDATIIAGEHAPVNSVHTLPEAEALLIIGAGRAVVHEAASAPAVEAAEVAPVAEQAAVAPKPEKKARAPKA